MFYYNGCYSYEIIYKTWKMKGQMMNFINYLSGVAIPFTILIIVAYGVIERKKTFDIFLDGVKEGIQIVIKIFPTLIGLFIAVGLLRSSGIIDIIIQWIKPVIQLFKIPVEIMPLAILRPISGSASMAIATDIMKLYNVNSQIGFMASVIMGATETTIYTIAIYSSSVGIKNTRFVLIASLLGDLIGLVVSVMVCRFLSASFS